MSCPHVSALAALVKSQYPTWTPSAIRSAIMTTGLFILDSTFAPLVINTTQSKLTSSYLHAAIQTNNLHAPITTNEGFSATPYDIGAGEISLSAPLQPGLVYETQPIDYLQFLCSMGYDMAKIKRIAPTLPTNFSCSASQAPDSISNMNYPSIAISGLAANGVKTVNRTVTNVGVEDSIYSLAVEAPAALHVEVVPNRLHFSRDVKTLSYEVTFKVDATPRGDLFGSITWSNVQHKVRSPFVVSKT